MARSRFIEELYHEIAGQSNPFISWVMGGAAFTIADWEQFLQSARSRGYFGKWDTFQRQLNLWGFKATPGAVKNTWSRASFYNGCSLSVIQRIADRHGLLPGGAASQRRVHRFLMDHEDSASAASSERAPCFRRFMARRDQPAISCDDTPAAEQASAVLLADLATAPLLTWPAGDMYAPASEQATVQMTDYQPVEPCKPRPATSHEAPWYWEGAYEVEELVGGTDTESSSSSDGEEEADCVDTTTHIAALDIAVLHAMELCSPFAPLPMSQSDEDKSGFHSEATFAFAAS
ncbi:hypothetical protein JKP88DRAFT_272997 [Tribonema minus]|uniref:HSF-type DNA-binding domain-containing protein n=1 Tax=Tribonema minus TaxID=303371 RepID=A0A835YYA8_9STRA|nr:hypothetical protein JKP88DRAFT_272997 [Tribonema minus]